MIRVINFERLIHVIKSFFDSNFIAKAILEIIRKRMNYKTESVIDQVATKDDQRFQLNFVFEKKIK